MTSVLLPAAGNDLFFLPFLWFPVLFIFFFNSKGIHCFVHSFARLPGGFCGQTLYRFVVEITPFAMKNRQQAMHRADLVRGFDLIFDIAGRCSSSPQSASKVLSFNFEKRKEKQQQNQPKRKKAFHLFTTKLPARIRVDCAPNCQD